MKVISEEYLRTAYRKKTFSNFQLKENQILTPSARQFLQEHRIHVQTAPHIATSEDSSVAAKSDGCPSDDQQIGRYVSALDGGHFSTKPEHMTQLRGNILVSKAHARIIFRGKLDSFQSALVLTQANAYTENNKVLSQQLGEILTEIKQIMKADVLSTPLEKCSLFGLSAGQIRKMSHSPKKYFGIGHVEPDYTMTKIVLELNQLRSHVREVEITAVAAFQTELQVERLDIIESINRMSSALYILMLKEISGKQLL